MKLLILLLILTACAAIACAQESCALQDMSLDPEAQALAAPADSVGGLDAIETPESVMNAGNLDAHPVNINTNQFYKETKYWGHYTALRAAGWGCFGLGFGCFIGGAITFMATMNESSSDGPIVGAALMLASPVLVVASIPLITMAYVNRRKAMKMKTRVNLDLASIPIRGVGARRFSAPALGVSIRL